MTAGMRVRMAPSPTGDIHIGNARTALMNYLMARQSGGTFILRVEDTDRERSDPQKEAGIYDGLRWLSLDWDEGPDVGGPYGPYRSSERHEVHREAIEALLASGAAYYDYTTAAERAAEREAQIAGGQTPRYSGSGRSLTAAQIAERQAAGIAPAVRFGSGSGAVGFDDGVFGPLETDAAEIEDFVIARGDGSALYNMAVVADDRSMAITHVVRGSRPHLQHVSPDPALPGAGMGATTVRAPAAAAQHASPEALEAGRLAMAGRVPGPGLSPRSRGELHGVSRLVAGRRARAVQPRRAGRGIQSGASQPRGRGL